jgi:thiamine pyrophosphokinase
LSTQARYALIFANGDYIDGEAVRAALNVPADADCLIIAADGGLRHVLTLGLTPHLVIGDMDSVDPADLAAVERCGAVIQPFPTAKDETDLELALLAATARGSTVIRVLAGIGDRFDQTISNVYLLALPQLAGVNAKLVSGNQTLSLIFPGKTRLSGQAGDTVSLVPVAGDATGIVTAGLEYPLRHETLRFGPARGVSNVMLSTEATVSLESGVLLLSHTYGRA